MKLEIICKTFKNIYFPHYFLKILNAPPHRNMRGFFSLERYIPYISLGRATGIRGGGVRLSSGHKMDKDLRVGGFWNLVYISVYNKVDVVKRTDPC